MNLRFQILNRFILIPVLMTSCGLADVDPVAIRVDQRSAWVGERLSFFVELRSSGSFAGAGTFEVPQLPGAIVLKIGSPVVASQQLEGESWFVQAHEFALFSQRDGQLTVPAFPVRFGCRDDFTGPVRDVQGVCPSFQVQIHRPPGSDQVPFLITTDSLDVSESWDPTPGPSEFGAIFKRTITQRAQQVPGMALRPAPDGPLAGIKVYHGQPMTNDRLERGDFLGERTETITYLVQQSGIVQLPAIEYVWWNPKTSALESTSLPAVTITVAPKPPSQDSKADAPRSAVWWVIVAGIMGLVLWQWRWLFESIHEISRRLNPPDRIAARALLKACHLNDASAANLAWTQWRNCQGNSELDDADLANCVNELNRQLYGLLPSASWRGDHLAVVFRNHVLARNAQQDSSGHSALPDLNPGPQRGSSGTQAGAMK